MVVSLNSRLESGKEEEEDSIKENFMVVAGVGHVRALLGDVLSGLRAVQAQPQDLPAPRPPHGAS